MYKKKCSIKRVKFEERDCCYYQQNFIEKNAQNYIGNINSVFGYCIITGSYNNLL